MRATNLSTVFKNTDKTIMIILRFPKALKEVLNLSGVIESKAIVYNSFEFSENVARKPKKRVSI